MAAYWVIASSDLCDLYEAVFYVTLPCLPHKLWNFFFLSHVCCSLWFCHGGSWNKANAKFNVKLWNSAPETLNCFNKLMVMRQWVVSLSSWPTKKTQQSCSLIKSILVVFSFHHPWSCVLRTHSPDPDHQLRVKLQCFKVFEEENSVKATASV